MATVSSPNHRPRLDRLDTTRTQPPRGAGLQLETRVSVLRDRLEARADSRAAGQVRDVIREARSHVRDWQPDRSVSADTSARYSRVVEQMRADGQRPEDAKCKSTFEFNRAALVYEARKDIKSALTDLDRSRRSGELDAAARAFNRLQNGLSVLRKYPPSTGSRAQDLQRQSAFTGPRHADPDRSNSKRATLDQLPAGWRDDVLLSARPADRPAVAALALSGCRPAELKGIRISKNENEDGITIKIRSAKYDSDRGIKTRELSFSRAELNETAAGRELSDWLGGREVKTISHQGTVEAFRERVARAADRAGHGEATAYSFRHAEARELRQEGADRQEIANRLGHRSERSQAVYG